MPRAGASLKLNFIGAAMQNLSLETICLGALMVRDNASELLEDAKLLRQHGRISRAYALAYMACEEAGKISILIGTATELVLGVPVDWKKTRKRFHSHDSKASQFVGLARAIPLLLEAAASGQKAPDFETIMIKAAVGTFLGPAFFEFRNASIYCDVVDDVFVSPSEKIKEAMADQMIKFATDHLVAARSTLGASPEEAAAAIRAAASRDRYDRIQTNAAELAGDMRRAFDVLRNKGTTSE